MDKDWQEKIFDLAEEYCDHERLGGDCLCRILGDIIIAEKEKGYQEGLEKAREILAGMKNWQDPAYNEALSEASQKIQEKIDKLSK